MINLFGFGQKRKRFLENRREYYERENKSMRNWRYYYKHREDILKKRRERYRLTGK